MSVLQNISSGVTYPNVFDNVDFEYFVNSDVIKENIIVKKKLKNYSFQISLQPKKVTPVLKEDNTVEFVNESREVVFFIPAPYMYDSNGAETNNVSLSLEQDKNHHDYTLTITADKEWIENDQRKFPVTIDPVVNIESTHQGSYSSGYMTRYSNGNWEKNPTCAHLYVGQGIGNSGSIGEHRSFFKLTTPSLREGDKVCEAYVNLCQYGSNYVGLQNSKYRINVYQITENWTNSSMKWDIAYDSNMIDSKNTDCLEAGWDCFDITRAVKSWYDNPSSNNGLLLAAENPNAGDARRYVSNDAQASDYNGYHPFLSVIYLNQTGLNDFNSYKNYDMGFAGNVYINEYTGKATTIVDDIAYGGNFPSIDIRHVNNTEWKDYQTGYGKGWSLNYCEYVLLLTSGDYPQKYKMKYRDEDGTELYFIGKEGSSELEDEVGRGYKVSMSTTDYPITLILKDGTKKKFNYAGYLCEIEYTDGKKTLITQVNNKPTVITDYAGRTATLTYNSDGMLTKISIIGDREINFSYSSGKLTSISHYNGLKSNYYYNSDNGLSEIDNGTMSLGIEYIDNKVKALYEDPYNGSAKHIMWVEYYKDKTLFTHPGPSADISSSCSDRFYEHCLFNNYGQKISDYVTNAYLTDSSMTPEVYGVECNEYTPVVTESGFKRNNKLLMSYAANDTHNYIRNMSFESGTQSWITGSNFSVQTDKNNAYIGNNSGKFSKSAAQTNDSITYQLITLPAGTYTLSAYVKVPDLQNGDFYLYILNGGSSTSAKSQTVSEKSLKWQRLFATVEITQTSTIRAEAIFEGSATGTVYFDCVQLERHDVANAPNLLENTNMENNYGWIASSGQTSESTNPYNYDGYSVWQTHLSGKAYRLFGDFTSEKYIYQEVTVKGSNSNTYILSGWGKGYGLPTENAPNSRFDVEIKITYGDGTTRTIEGLKFDRYNQDWQYLSKTFTAEHPDSPTRTIDKIGIYCYFSKNAGCAYFDDIQLVKDNVSSYTYDDDGNMTSQKDLAEQKSEYAFSNNELVRAISPNGSSYINTYDSNDKNRLISSVGDGVTYAYEYDSQGNVTSARSLSGAIESNRYYYIITPNKNMLVDLWFNDGTDGTRFVSYTANHGTAQTMKIVEESTGLYSIRPEGHEDKALSCKNSGTTNGTEIVLQSFSNADSQLWRITKNSDGTYSFTPKHASGMRLDSPKPNNDTDYRGLILYTKNTDKQQSFILEARNDTDSLYTEATATYDEGGVHLKSISNMDGKAAEYSYRSDERVSSVVGPKSKITYSYRQNASGGSLLDYSAIEQDAAEDTRMASAYYYYTGQYLTKIKTGGPTYTLVYDDFGNRTNTKVNSLSLMTNTYKSDNRSLDTSTYGNGDYVTYSYDKYNRNTGIRKVTDNKWNHTASWTYDTFGNISRLIDNIPGYGRTTDYIYDSIGRLSQFKRSDRFGGKVNYDAYNRVTSKTYDIVDESRKTSYIYDNKTNLVETVETDKFWLDNYYDNLNRVYKKTLQNKSSFEEYEELFEYRRDGNRTDSQVTSHTFKDVTMNYEYDESGNIIKITDKDGKILNEYAYDALNRLTVEKDARTKYWSEYSYNMAGNITSKVMYFCRVDEATNSFVKQSYYRRQDYKYENNNWKDLCTSFSDLDGTYTITYDEIGNPLNYRNGMTMTWQNGRQLRTLQTESGKKYEFVYDINGQRISKTEYTNGAVSHWVDYYYDGTRLIGESKDGTLIWYDYDENGTPIGMKVNGSEYLFRRNLQGDITGIYNEAGTLIAEYTYNDAWGYCTLTSNSNMTIGNYNSLRYRGYYFDSETELYYLNSRYYDPTMRRFVNADSLIDNRDVNNLNIFSYCVNNPVNNKDVNGHLVGAILAIGAFVVGCATLLSGCASNKSPTSTTSSSSRSRSTKPSIPSTSQTYVPSQKEKIYAATVYAEAGGQNRRSKQAVAHVMNNRIGTRSSWIDIEAVLSAAGQFDGYNSPMFQSAMDYYNNGVCDNSINKAAMDECMDVIIPIYSGAEADITGGALYFHSYPNPSDWAYHDAYTQVYISGTEKFWFYK